MIPLPPVSRKRQNILDVNAFRGLNNRDAATDVGDTESPTLLNVDFSEVGAVSKRNGTTIAGDDKGNSKVLGLHSAYYGDGSAQLLVASQGFSTAGLGFRTGTTYTEATKDAGGTKLANADAEMESFFDGTNQAVFIVDGSKLQKYVPASNTLFDATAVPADGEASSVIRLYKNRLYLAGPTSSLRERVWFSDLGDGDAWTAGNYFDVPSTAITSKGTSGDPITALAVFQNQLVIFKNRSIWTWDTNTLRQITDKHGCVGKRAFCLTDNHLYFADNDGIYRMSGGFVEKASKKIQGTWDVIPGARMPEIAMESFDNKIFVATAAAGAANNNIVLVNYHSLPQDEEGQTPWSYWNSSTTDSMSFSSLKTYEQTTATLPVLIGGLTTAQTLTLHLDTGTADYDEVAGTSTKAIISYYRTKVFSLNGFLRRLFATYKTQSAASLLQTATIIDFDARSVSNDFQMQVASSSVYGTGVYGTATYGGQVALIGKGLVSARAKYVQYLFQNNSASQPWTLYRLQQIYSPLSLR